MLRWIDEVVEVIHRVEHCNHEAADFVGALLRAAQFEERGVEGCEALIHRRVRTAEAYAETFEADVDADCESGSANGDAG